MRQTPTEDEIRAALHSLLAAHRRRPPDDPPAACLQHPIDRLSARRLDNLTPPEACREILEITAPIFITAERPDRCKTKTKT